MQKITYKRTWCDYITKCPFKDNGTMVGDYTCQHCEHFVENIDNNIYDNSPCTYSKYFKTYTCTIICNNDKIIDNTI